MIGLNQRAIVWRTVLGKQYGVQWAETVDGPWNTTGVVVPTTKLKRFGFEKPARNAFYRVLLAQ